MGELWLMLQIVRMEFLKPGQANLHFEALRGLALRSTTARCSLRAWSRSFPSSLRFSFSSRGGWRDRGRLHTGPVCYLEGISSSRHGQAVKDLGPGPNCAHPLQVLVNDRVLVLRDLQEYKARR